MNDPIRFPLFTGQAAHVINSTEPDLAETVRRGHVKPEPPILSGRRLWHRNQLLQAAKALGLLTDELRTALEDAITTPEEVRK